MSDYEEDNIDEFFDEEEFEDEDEDEVEEKEEKEEGEEGEEDESESDYEEEVDTYDVDDKLYKKQIFIAPEDRQTSDTLTSYEESRLIQIRAQQIANTGQYFCHIDQNTMITTEIELAQLEFKQKKMPLEVHRIVKKNANGDIFIERWKLSEFR